MTIQGDNAAYERWVAQQDRPDGHPIIATAIGAIALIIGIVASPRPYPGMGDAALVGGAALVALLVWGVAFAITIRHSSILWKVGSLLLLLLIAALGASVSIRQARMEAFRKDLTALTEIRMTADGKLELPKDSDRGTFSRISITYLKAMSDEAKARDMALTALGLDRIANVQAILREPSLLRDCDRFPRNRSIVDDAGTRMQGYIDSMIRDIRASDIPEDIRAEMLRGFDIDKAQLQLAASTALSREQLEVGGKLCAILARRHWTAQGANFVFASTADMNSYNGHIDRWNEMFRRAQTIQAEGRASMAAGQQQIRDSLRR